MAGHHTGPWRLFEWAAGLYVYAKNILGVQSLSIDASSSLLPGCLPDALPGPHLSVSASVQVWVAHPGF